MFCGTHDILVTDARRLVARAALERSLAEKNEYLAKLNFDLVLSKKEVFVQTIEPERLFSFRWHPFAIELGVDYSKEATTLIVFELEEAPKGGVVLTVRESGFDHIPLERRAKAFASNDGGWAMQMKLVEKFLAQST